MYLRTPKRYTPRGRRRRLLNLRWWWLYLLTALVVVVGAGIWQNRAMFQRMVSDAIATAVRAGENRIATLQAPTPTPTDSPYNYLAVANAAYERGAMDEAITNYALAAEGMPNDVAVFFRLAHLMITNGQERQALSVAERAINADPYDPRGWAIRGMAYDWLGDYDRALASLLRALELDPDNAITLSFLAETYTDMGATDRALEAAERALELEPADFNVQRNYGYALQQGAYDFEGAIRAYERALQLAPSQAYIAFTLAELYRAQGDYDAEIQLLRDMVERNPESATAHYNLSLALWRDLGQFEQARAAVESCTSIAPNHVACLSFLGRLQLRAGEYNLCARSFDRAIQAGSQNPADYYNGGFCHIVTDNCPRATDILRQGLALTDDPETLTDIRDALAQCQVVITLEPTVTPTPEATSVLEEGDAESPESASP